VNFALEEMVDSGDWQRDYNEYLKPELGDGSPPDAINP
jgi:hypothetical protein